MLKKSLSTEYSNNLYTDTEYIILYHGYLIIQHGYMLTFKGKYSIVTT